MASYRDRSYSSGVLSWDSLTFESTSVKAVVFPNISIGCGKLNRGTFDMFTAGIVGLGNSDLSLPNQLSASIDRKFAYCMVPLRYNVSSKISFGSNAMVSRSRVQTIPFFTRDADPFYYLNLESVSIGATNIKFDCEIYRKNADDQNDGNIVIDSGTTLTYFPSEFYKMIEDEFKRIISSTPVKGAHSLRLCYKNDQSFEEKVPTVTFHFTGAKWKLGVSNTMISLEDGTICLSMAPGNLAIFGNLQQMDYLVQYDLSAKTLSFVKTNCAKQ